MSAFLQDFDRLVPPGARLGALPEGALAWGLSQLKEPLWVVVPEEEEAERLTAAVNFFRPEAAALFPADDVHPYEGVSPHPDLVRARLVALRARLRIAPARAFAHRVLPPALLDGCPRLAKGVEVEPGALARTLADLGYLSVQKLEDPGTFSLRGDILHVWATGRERPVRVEFFGDEVESLREDGAGPLPELRILPAREEVLGEAALRHAQTVLRARVLELGYGERLRREVLEDVQAGVRFAGMDTWLPALHPLVSPLAYGGRVLVLRPVAVREALHKLEDELATRHAAVPLSDRPLVGPFERWRRAAEVLAELEGAAEVGSDRPEVDIEAVEPVEYRPGAQGLAPVAGRIGALLAEDWRVALAVEGSTRADRVRQLLHPHGLSPLDTKVRDPGRWPPGKLLLIRGDLPAGFLAHLDRVAVLTASDLLSEKVRVRAPARGTASKEAAIASFAQLKEEDLVVHERHGIGRFKGLKRVDLGWGPQDMLQLEYRAGDLMFLPVHQLDRLYRYRAVGGAVDPRLDKLGGETWTLRKTKVKDAVAQLAAEIIGLEARRKLSEARAYEGKTEKYRRFEDLFPYVETDDQLKAIEEVLEDLAQPQPMDRLVVGDVGFGKTEVAMRAVFRVAEEGQQVAVLCPTTVLAFQHLQTFKRRFEPFGIRVEMLSRFTGDEAALLREVKAGEVRVLIGTTRLLGRSVRFADLGLVVVDEEHRFGVAQKDKLKKMREDGHYLAMSATPIPRSLQMALSGIRGISTIGTPPRDRLPVRTAVAPWSLERVREEILRELQRGGQVFFVHNRIASIETVAAAIRTAVPEAKVEVAHGEMDEEHLEGRLIRFQEKRFEILVCTAIIESGIDMPNVNTILVNDADQFGLAQLYQLRGRVGRSHNRGYCTLLVGEGKTLTEEAMKRLQVLQEHTRLGSGLAVATADLELRGAGDILGDRQHGQVAAVGFETYLALLEEAMDAARGDVARQRIDPEVEVKVPALLPEAWIPELDERLLAYRRLAGARTVEQVRAIVDELEGSWGLAPVEALNFGRLLEIKARCRLYGLPRITVMQVRLVIELGENHTLKPDKALKEQPRRFSRKGNEIEARFTPDEGKQPFFLLHWVLDQLAG